MTTSSSAPRGRLGEVFALYLAVLVAIRIVIALFRGVLWDAPLALVPILFMYAPVWLLRARGEDPDAYPLAVPAFEERDVWTTALRLNALAILAIFPAWVVLYHFWQTTWFPEVLHVACDVGVRGACGVALPGVPVWVAPWFLPKLVAYHLFFVAIPEEMFYRGYMQSRLDERFGTPWRLGGADLGWGWLLTNLLFAFGHSIVDFQWWHFAIFFPSLVFGWMRARTGGVMAGAFFHAWCNVTVTTLDVFYGLVQPDSL